MLIKYLSFGLRIGIAMILGGVSLAFLFRAIEPQSFYFVAKIILPLREDDIFAIPNALIVFLLSPLIGCLGILKLPNLSKDNRLVASRMAYYSFNVLLVGFCAIVIFGGLAMMASGQPLDILDRSHYLYRIAHAGAFYSDVFLGIAASLLVVGVLLMLISILCDYLFDADFERVGFMGALCMLPLKATFLVGFVRALIDPDILRSGIGGTWVCNWFCGLGDWYWRGAMIFIVIIGVVGDAIKEEINRDKELPDRN